jgi:hypothetical protein
MTLQEIQDLAGHRDVPPWVVKLVGDAVAKEREACAKYVESLYVGNTPLTTVMGAIGDAIRARGQA